MKTIKFNIILIILSICATFAEQEIPRHFAFDLGDKRIDEGNCRDSEKIFKTLMAEAMGICSHAVNKMIPPSVCSATYAGFHVMECAERIPGIAQGCFTTCTLDYETCEQDILNKFLGVAQAIKQLAENFISGGLLIAMDAISAAGDIISNVDTIGGIHSSQEDVDAYLNSKRGLREVFRQGKGNAVMEIAQAEFNRMVNLNSAEQGALDPEWRNLGSDTSKTILATACRVVLDKALHLAESDPEQTVKRFEQEKKSYGVFHDNAPEGCLDIEGMINHGDMSDSEIRSVIQDCAGILFDIASMFDITGLSTLASTFNDEPCPDFTDPNDEKYSPREDLGEDHPWHKIIGDVASQLPMPFSTEKTHFDMETVDKEDRGDGLSIMHQLKGELLSESCKDQEAIRYAKGICRPLHLRAMTPESMLSVLEHATASPVQVVTGAPHPDSCCDSERRAITDGHTCWMAFEQLKIPHSTYDGDVSDVNSPYGCIYDIRNNIVRFNQQKENHELLGFDEVICNIGDNTYQPSFFTKIARAGKYVIGDRGQRCKNILNVIRYKQHCTDAARVLDYDRGVIEKFDDESFPAGCSIMQGGYIIYNKISAPDSLGSGRKDSIPLCYQDDFAVTVMPIRDEYSSCTTWLDSIGDPRPSRIKANCNNVDVRGGYDFEYFNDIYCCCVESVFQEGCSGACNNNQFSHTCRSTSSCPISHPHRHTWCTNCYNGNPLPEYAYPNNPNRCCYKGSKLLGMENWQNCDECEYGTQHGPNPLGECIGGDQCAWPYLHIDFHYCTKNKAGDYVSTFPKEFFQDAKDKIHGMIGCDYVPRGCNTDANDIPNDSPTAIAIYGPGFDRHDMWEGHRPHIYYCDNLKQEKCRDQGLLPLCKNDQWIPAPCPGLWKTKEWSQCSASCGLGFQTRLVFCEGVQDCKDEYKPERIQSCNIISCDPTISPTIQPSDQPTGVPTLVQPSVQPSNQPSESSPSRSPSTNPTAKPSIQPQTNPTFQPSIQPQTNPTVKPSTNPSVIPSVTPSTIPSIATTIQIEAVFKGEDSKGSATITVVVVVISLLAAIALCTFYYGTTRSNNCFGRKINGEATLPVVSFGEPSKNMSPKDGLDMNVWWEEGSQNTNLADGTDTKLQIPVSNYSTA